MEVAQRRLSAPRERGATIDIMMYYPEYKIGGVRISILVKLSFGLINSTPLKNKEQRVSFSMNYRKVDTH